jgi:predicted phage-related endonuclease
MLNADQFIVSKGLDESGWLDARQLGVSATTIAKAMTPAGYREVVESWGNRDPIPPNPYMEFGTASEGWLAMWAKSQFGTIPSDWLIRHATRYEHIATPDGLSLDHVAILEVKTTGKDWGSLDKIPIQYRRQVQWQMYVVGAEYCVFVWMLREEHGGIMSPAWLEPKAVEIDRDEGMINQMVETADKLWAEIGGN